MLSITHWLHRNGALHSVTPFFIFFKNVHISTELFDSKPFCFKYHIWLLNTLFIKFESPVTYWLNIQPFLKSKILRVWHFVTSFSDMLKFLARVLLRAISALNIIISCLIMFLQSLNHQQRTGLTHWLHRNGSKRSVTWCYTLFQKCCSFMLKFYCELFLL